MFNILIQSKAQMKSFNIAGWKDYAQLKPNNPPEPWRCFPRIFFPWVVTKCHSFVLMEGQPSPPFENIRHSIELCIQVPQIEPNTPNGAQDLLLATIWFWGLKGMGMSQWGTKWRCETQRGPAPLPPAIPASHPVVLSQLFCLPKVPHWHREDHHVALLWQWSRPGEPLHNWRPQLLCANSPPVLTLSRSPLGATCLSYPLCFMARESC